MTAVVDATPGLISSRCFNTVTAVTAAEIQIAPWQQHSHAEFVE